MTEVKNDKKNDYEKALEAYSQAMKAFHKGDLEKSCTALKELMGKYPNEHEFIDRSRIYISICEKRESPPKIQLKTFDDYFQFGIYNINMGHYDEALKSLAKASEKNPKEGKVIYAMAIASLKSGNKADSANFLKKAVEQDPFFAILAQNEVDFEEAIKEEEFSSVIESK